MHLTDKTALAGVAPGYDEADNDAVNMAALTRALDVGQVDVAVHCLQLLLFKTDQRKTVKNPRVRRLKTLQSAVTQMLSDYDNCKEDDGLSLRPGLGSSSVDPSCELSYAQLQMFALQRMQPSSTAYNVVRALQFSDVELDLFALENTCDALMAKHEALRTCFDVDMSAAGHPRQVVHPLSYFRARLRVVRVVQTNLVRAENGEASSNSELSAYVAKTTDEPFDLACQAPIRVYVFTSPNQSSSSQWILAVVLHHIVTDASSSQIFWNDFHELYAKFSLDDEAKATSADFVQQLELKASGTTRLTYRDFAVWQRLRMRSGTTAPLLQYWIEQLTEGGAPPLLELPFDHGVDNLPSERPAAPESTTTKGDVVVFRSSAALQRAFSELCHAQGASMFMGLLAVFYLLVERLTEQQDFVIGAPSSGRDSAELQGIMGYFVNTLPLRLGVNCTGNEDFKSFLACVRDVVLGAYNHMEIPFHKVLEHLRASAHSDCHAGGESERRWQHPVFQIMFSWEQNNQESSTDKYAELVLPHHSAKFDLMLSMRYRHLDGATSDRVLEGSMEYPTARFERATVKRFTNYFLELLEQVTRTPTAPVLSPSIRMMPDSERKQLISKWGMPKLATLSTQRPSCEFVDECLFSQVRKTPQNPALHYEGTQWTYQDLWDHSGRVTDALRMLDIPRCAAEVHIGLLLDRGLENVAAMVATLRHKAVFVPLDPEFPRERLRYMARDSGLQVIITQRKHTTIAAYLSASSIRVAEDEDELAPCVLCYEDVDVLTSHRSGLAKDSDLLGIRESHDSNRAAAYILYTSGVRPRPALFKFIVCFANRDILLFLLL
jgi:non-ribosomal peptide synthetase component F